MAEQKELEKKLNELRKKEKDLIAQGKPYWDLVKSLNAALKRNDGAGAQKIAASSPIARQLGFVDTGSASGSRKGETKGPEEAAAGNAETAAAGGAAAKVVDNQPSKKVSELLLIVHIALNSKIKVSDETKAELDKNKPILDSWGKKIKAFDAQFKRDAATMSKEALAAKYQPLIAAQKESVRQFNVQADKQNNRARQYGALKAEALELARLYDPLFNAIQRGDVAAALKIAASSKLAREKFGWVDPGTQ